MAEELGLSEKELLIKVNELKEKGYLKRIAAALRHQRVGYVANAMVVWRVPAEMAVKVGQKLAQHPAVSHCYLRTTRENWPYNLYTMIHGQTRSECNEIVSQMAESVDVTDYLVLYSTRELKKSSMQY